jgi:YD repeat-containing protein
LGNSTKGIGPVTSTLNHAANAVSNKIPIQSAPNPKDLKLWMVQKSPAYRGNFEIVRVKVGPTADTYLDTPDVMKPLAPQEALTAEATNTFAVERMVNINFEYWTAGLRGQKRMKRPLKVLDPSDMATLGENDRTDSISKSAVVRMISTPDGGVNMMITDPDFEWPIEAPSAMYVTWTANPTTPKLGGGIRVKRILSNDGRRSFSTSYAYTDLVNGDWTTSGVAAQEPPPVGYAADDDRVIQTERGGWANEGGGGIYHSRVVVRHGWSEDKRPAGTKLDDGSRVDSPLGETVFRFISPADLPHRLKKVDYALNSVSTDPTTGMMTNKTNSAAITEIFNMGAWWGQLLWKEDRDQAGHVLGRAENYYTQLEGYLRLFDLNEQGRAGYDPDVEKAWSDSRQNDMSFAWASRGANESNPNLPLLVQKEAQNPLQLGSDFQGAHLGYLNTTVNITTIGVSTNRRQFRRYIPSWKWKDLGDGELLDVDESTGESDLGWHSSVQAVREINLAPIVREIRTYGEGLNLLNLTRNTRWEARTGTVLETETRGRRVSGATGNPWDGHEILVNRNWPAYWFFPGMESLNMLSQKAQTTTSRKTPIGIGYDETFLNSKVSTWFTNGHHWVKGGEFVWNGVSNGAPPMAFPGYASWQPSQISPTNIQPYKSQQWLFAGATTIYDDFSHAIEAVDGDGVYGCSKYGYPYDVIGAGNLPAGILPTAKFANAKNTETLYWNFEGSNGLDGMKVGDIFDSNPNPIARLAKVYTGERAYSLGGPQGSLPVTLPGTASEMEIRFFVKAANAAQAKSVYPSGQATEIISATQAEGGWWFVRAKAVRSAGATRTLSGATSLDDVAVYPWRNQGAPVSISHYAYDRALGLVTSITGSNGRTTRYQYDSLGRLQQVFDVYGKSTSSTRYKHAAN